MISANLATIFICIEYYLFALRLSSQIHQTRKLLRDCWNDNRNRSDIPINWKLFNIPVYVIIFLVIGGAIGAFIAFKIR